MKGVLFNIVQDVVEDTFGADVWDDVVDLAGIDGSYTSLGNYPDEDLAAIVAAVAELAHVGRDDVVVLAGRKGFPHLAERHADLLVGMSGWRDVVGSLDDLIHPEVRKIYPESRVPTFSSVMSDEAMLLDYRSDRHLCRLAEGLLLGLGDWFETGLTVVHLSCVHRGDDGCRMEVRES